MAKELETEATTRRPYHKPHLEQVQLVAEEAVLRGCKTRQGTGGPSSTPCLIPPGAPCKGAAQS
jgi:hypothetical protein